MYLPAAGLGLGFSGGIERIAAYICMDNDASLRLVQGLGFTREGERRDHYPYAILEEEWRC